MISLLKKEWNSFFGSITGYLVIGIFLLSTSLFLWVIPGNYNIIEGQQATLKNFFELAPWLYLFLIPAITMRMLAEEKRTGTIEMLITRPLSSYQIVFAKYLAALLLVFISLVPTLLYFISVYQLGNPVGNIDTGATWGSFIGLLLLASVYIAIGIFSSVISANQVISFLVAFVITFISYLGFDFVASTPIPIIIQDILLLLGIHEHYRSISRGVIDSGDLLYFTVSTFIFIYFTKQLIQKHKKLFRLKSKYYIPLLLFIFIVIWGIKHRIFRIDLTAENRYSLSETTVNLLKTENSPVHVEIYLAGKLPAGMKEFQESIIEKIEDLNAYSPSRISYEIIDVYEIQNNQERNKLIEGLVNAGVQPVNLEHKTTEGLSTQQIFPGVIFKNNHKAIALNLLQNNPMISADERFQQSIELLEYEYARALKYLHQKDRPKLAFLKKQGIASPYETGDIRFSLSENYDIVDRSAHELLGNDSIQILIIAAPTEPFTEEEKFYIDQFIMRNGKVLWCIDPVSVSIDSLSRGLSTLAFEKGINLRDQLFRYGVRLNSDLLQDAFCLQYPINTAPQGQPSKFSPAPFYYAPLALPGSKHPLSRNLNNVLLEFASSLDSLGNIDQITSTAILTTSPYARSIQTPVDVSLMSATNPPDQQLFNQQNITIGMLLEGRFESVFNNRMTVQYNATDFIEQSNNTKMIVIADGEIIKNKVRHRNGQVQILPLGYDQYSDQTFGNRDFIINCIDYLADDSGLMQLRSRVIKLRLIDKVKIRDQKTTWQLLNTLLPLVVFAIFGLLFAILRNRKYNRISN